MRLTSVAVAIIALLFVALPLAAQSCPPAAADPILDPSAPGLAGMSRLASFDHFVDVWLDPANHVTQSVSCPTGTCLWVPWYASSDSCTTSNLHTKCGLAPDGSYTISCLASDEFSQVGMALAMSSRQTAFDQWVATVRFLVNGSTSGQLPAWLAGRNGNTFSITDGGDASDATARILIALYVAANSDRFTNAAAKAGYASLADGIAQAFLTHDFVTRTLTLPDGTTITHWLGGGSGTAGGHPSLDCMESWAGYYGDVVIALLAAYRSSGDPTYALYAVDTINSYFAAASYGGGHFAVPPEKFTWHVAADETLSISCDYCPQWDFDDAPRAVSLCKAEYAAALSGVELGARLGRYCTQWLESGGVASNAYQQQYLVDGTPAHPPNADYYANGLGASLHFAREANYLWPKLQRALADFSTSSNTFGSGATCMGVYKPAFTIVNLGSSIGLDAKAFTQRSCASGADAQPPGVLFRADCGAVIDPFTASITLHGTAVDDRKVHQVSWALSGSSAGSGIALGTAAWTIGPLPLNRGATSIQVTAHDDAGNTSSDTCSVVIGFALPSKRRDAQPRPAFAVP